MRRAGLTLLLAVLLAGCSGGSDRGVNAQALQQKAGAITDLMAQNAWAQVRQDFDATMRRGLSEDQLAAGWQQVVQQQGAYRSRGTPTQVRKPGAVVVFDTPMTFERGEMKSRVSFAENGQVAGLFILLPTVP